VRKTADDTDDVYADDNGGRRQWAIAFLGFLLRRPRDTLAVAMTLAAFASILVNALFLQPTPHPAPLFSLKPKQSAAGRDATGGVVLPRPRPPEASPRAVPAVQPAPSPRTEAPQRAAPQRSRSEIITDVQRQLARRGLYDGPVDGIDGGKTGAAIRKLEKTAGLPLTGEATEALLKAMAQMPAAGSAGSPGSAARAAKPHVDLIAALLPRLEQSQAQPRVASGGEGEAVAAVPPADPIAPAPRAEPTAPPAGGDKGAPVSTKQMKAVQQALTDFGYGQVKPTGIADADTRAAIKEFETVHRLPPTGEISDRFLHELAAVTERPVE
jgi:peptidoglycan hydrolase-like protein with peptidoglycan-binding domain